MDPPAQKLLQELELQHWFSSHQACVCRGHLFCVNVWLRLCDVIGASGHAELQGWQPDTIVCGMITGNKGTSNRLLSYCNSTAERS